MYQSFKVYTGFGMDDLFDDKPRSELAAIEFAEELAYEIREPVEVRRGMTVIARFESTDSIVRTI